MTSPQQSRRAFLGTSTRLAASSAFAAPMLALNQAARGEAKNDRPQVAAIGVGWTPERTARGTRIAKHATKFADVVAVCDVDRRAAEHGKEAITEGKAKVYENYQDVLARDDIDAVIIGTPDHWHTKIAIEAMKSGRDVYCEKPLTLTIDEGKLICKVVRETKRVFQVGTQQRTEFGGNFLTAVALAREGRAGKIQRVTVAIGPGMIGGPFKVSEPPPELNWNLWLGQAPKVPYIKERCHRMFRWWYEYSGGKITDWGAHHVDIAQWGIGMENSGPVSVEGIATLPRIPNGYNTATAYDIIIRYPNGVEMNITHWGEKGVTFIGDKDQFYVCRKGMSGKPTKEIKKNPLPEGAIEKLTRGQRIGSHMRNFFDCVKTRETPISDVFTHHRSLTTCHLANLCLRLGRKLTWDPEKEQIVGDDVANAMLKRRQREGFEIKA